MTRRDTEFYDTIHQWLRYNHGKALCCENPDCSGKSKNYQWALIKGKKYEKNRDNFMWLCRSCHATYDFTEETREKMRKLRIGVRPSPMACFLLGMRVRGVPKSEAQRKKMSLARKNKKAVLMIDNGRIIKRFESITNAAKFISRLPTQVSSVIHGRGKTAGGYSFVFDTQALHKLNTTYGLKGKK